MITLEEAKAHCRIEHDAEDSLVQSLISAAFRQIENRTGQAFDHVADAEMVLDSLPSGDSGIELKWTPVRAVKGVVYLDPLGVEQTLSGADLLLDVRGVYPMLYPAQEWPESKRDRASVKVTADIGYETVPADVRAAALLIIGHLYENREAVVIGTIATELPLGVDLLLAPYVIHRMG
ncbi:head-tail connector protein [Marinobacter koreensis]|uniref:Head-tail connector protein n=1 Tax=Marinobacter koreensis TaxID=335974 RepID=A0ABW0RJ08_9GAMM|nr:head-tail connector protein [Marinobacter koreensis]MCK7547189.1 head-tail connector protein [Marinobacter koreensis]